MPVYDRDSAGKLVLVECTRRPSTKTTEIPTNTPKKATKKVEKPSSQPLPDVDSVDAPSKAEV